MMRPPDPAATMALAAACPTLNAPVRLTATMRRPGGRKVHKEGHRITHIRIKRLPRGKFTIKIVALVNTGERVISVRRYDGCKKGRPHTHVEQPKVSTAR